ncbi:MAG: hypothetical protein DI630_16885 [Gordonia sp. (in: high G+C Gram-positive bacteria)]|nr:MAG: hypothetical protein DI630_16885 [Gordonia sp. (in: high G+C Gram-positive bacteria)]
MDSSRQPGVRVVDEVTDEQVEPLPWTFVEDAGIAVDASVEEVVEDRWPVGQDVGPGDETIC